MAASPLRDRYDCIVLGRSESAAKLAAELARRGLQTLHMQTRQPQPKPLWLQPRLEWDQTSSRAGLLGLSEVTAYGADGQRLATLQPAAVVPQKPPLPRSASETISTDAQLSCQKSDEICWRDSLGEHSLRADLILAVADRPQVQHVGAIGGVYRGLATASEGARHAEVFATQRGDESFWLIPLPGGLTSLGLWRTSSDLETDSPADIFEEALVACPAITQRLINAQLLGNLHSSPASAADLSAESLSGAVWLPDYESWLDPIFASGRWLAEECIQEVVSILANPGKKLAGQRERLTDWLTSWSAVEQQTRERITAWYQPAVSLIEFLHDPARRVWYEQRLADEIAATIPALPTVSWEARPPLLPRRVMSL